MAKNNSISLDRIALCLPGGGFRAAGYSLGILDLLHELGLLDNLKSISSVSGGTITAARYAYNITQEKESYEDFHNSLYNWLKSNQLLPSALKDLNSRELFGHKRKNLINAFALQYAEYLPITFKQLEDSLDKSDTLNHVIFNSTEFTNGLQFRFVSGSSRFGNGKSNFEELKPYVKLGDVVAASSCFPLAFEPISFPDDFLEAKQLEKVKLDNKDKDYASIGLMDGGILDNLGVLSHLTGRGDTNKYSTFIVGDAGSLAINAFSFSGDGKWSRRIAMLFSWWTFFASALIVASVYYFDLHFLVKGLVSTLFYTLFIFQIIFQVLVSFGKRRLNLKSALKLPRGKLGLFLLDRINSVVLLNLSIFLKGAKGSNLDSFYSRYKNKVCNSQIYLFEGTINYKDKLSELGIDVTPKLVELSVECSGMDTTLWFTDAHMKDNILDKLILCGKLTCCYSLMQQQVKLKGDDYMDLDSDAVFQSFRKAWNKMIQGNSKKLMA